MDCHGCGLPPSGKWKWRARICDVCRSSISHLGYTTTVGRLVREGLQPPTHYCGYVTLPGVCLPPPPEKFADFDFSGTKGLYLRKGKLWRRIFPDQLFLLNSLLPPAPRAMLCGPAVAGAYPVVSAINQFNVGKALWGRLYRKPRCTPQGPAFQVAHQNLRLLLNGLDTPTPPMTRAQWLESMVYNRRRRELAEAGIRLDRTGWLDIYGRYHFFNKSEKLVGFSFGSGQNFLPLTHLLDRVIQAPADEAHCVAGPRLKPLLLKLKECWGPNNFIF